MEEFHFKNNELHCEAASVEEIARRFGTPLYVYSKNSILDHSRHIEKALGSANHLSCYAVKANSNSSILRLLSHEGIGADVGSIGELKLALDAGFAHDKITFSGVGKRDDEIEYALQNNILALNVESEEELRVIQEIASRLQARARICLRVNFNIEADTHPYVTTGTKQNKFGVERARAKDILTRAGSMQNVEVLGIHSHVGSQITEPQTFVAAAKEVVELSKELQEAGVPITRINFGGGFGVQYFDFITHPLLPTDNPSQASALTTVSLLEAAMPILQRSGCNILIQPGRSIVAHAGILVTKVLYKKRNGDKNFVITDAGMNDLIRPSLYQSYHQIVPLQLKDAKHETVDVVGPLCETGDFFALDRLLPEVHRGDTLALLCAGAYGFVLASNYNARPRPAEVLVDGSECELIRQRESLNRDF